MHNNKYKLNQNMSIMAFMTDSFNEFKEPHKIKVILFYKNMSNKQTLLQNNLSLCKLINK